MGGADAAYVEGNSAELAGLLGMWECHFGLMFSAQMESKVWLLGTEHSENRTGISIVVILTGLDASRHCCRQDPSREVGTRLASDIKGAGWEWHSVGFRETQRRASGVHKATDWFQTFKNCSNPSESPVYFHVGSIFVPKLSAGSFESPNGAFPKYSGGHH